MIWRITIPTGLLLGFLAYELIRAPWCDGDLFAQTAHHAMECRR